MPKIFIPICFLVLLVTACTGAAGVPPAVEATPTTDQGSPQTNQPVQWAAWSSGPHAAGFNLGKGPNTYCARCHSPANWDPEARIDPPPNCVSCKFPQQEQVTIAKSNPLIPEDDWLGTGCATCHRIEAGRAAGPALAWQNVRTGYIETPASTTELCEKCHQNTETLRHGRALGAGAHAGYTCTDCHDHHTMAASCSDAGCHAERPPSPGHDAAHAQVDCGACHDASGLEVGPSEDGTGWGTFQNVSVAGRESVKPLQAHNLQRSVDCTRCHFPGNPWGLETGK